MPSAALGSNKYQFYTSVVFCTRPGSELLISAALLIGPPHPVGGRGTQAEVETSLTACATTSAFFDINVAVSALAPHLVVCAETDVDLVQGRL